MVEEPKSIVVVEDDAGMRKALERLLRVAGYKTELFPSAEAMIAAQAADSADCLILDIHLPGISGIELLRRLSASGRRSPVIFITAQDDDAAREEAPHALGDRAVRDELLERERDLREITNRDARSSERDRT